MTIFDAKGLLFVHFSKNDYYSEIEHFKSIIPISDCEELDKCIIIEALVDLEKIEIIRKLPIASPAPINPMWILTHPLMNAGQSVQIGKQTIVALYEILTHLAEVYKVDSVKVNPFDIRENDINNLIIFVETLLKNKQDSVDF